MNLELFFPRVPEFDPGFKIQVFLQESKARLN